MARVLIIGAGIGGLTTAIGIHRSRIEAVVLEQTAELREIGSAISLWPNALKALAHFGIADTVRRLAIEEGSGCLRSCRGTTLSQIDLRELGRQLGDLTVVLRRAELLSVLRDAAFGAKIRLGARCVGFEQNERCAKAFLADGSSVEGDLLIGADGLHSVIRAQLFGPREPRYAGYVAWRAITEFEHGRLTPGISLGRGSQFGQVPLKEINRVYWFATRNLSHRMHGTSENPKPDLLAVFAQWHKPVTELIEATEERAILRTELYDRAPLKRWGRGRVTLLGDAAHPMTPDLGQGACQALEDAAVLTRCLENTNDPVSALRAYEAHRIRRANSFVRASRTFGRLFQLERNLLCRLRDRFLKSAAYHRLQLNGLRRLADFAP